MTAPERSVNWPILTASFLMAAMLWAVVFNQDSTTNNVLLQVRPQGLDETRFSIKNLRRSILVNFRGNPGFLRTVAPENLIAYVDLSQGKPGRYNYPVRVTPVSLGDVATDVPKTIQVELEKVISRQFVIEAEATKKLRNDAYTVQGYRFDPPNATVRGPKSEVDKVTGVKAVVPLDEIDPEQPGPFEVSLRTEGTPLEYAHIEPVQARASILYAAAPAERDLLVRPTVQGRPADGYLAVSYANVPQRVTARGDAVVLASLSQISTEPIDLTGLKATETRRVNLSIPPGVTVKPTYIKFTVRIEPQSLPKPPPANPNPNPLPDPTGGGNP
ncbi:hypothetical protein BH11ARM2_BH11ARM2_23180 [soil metagenome]